MKKYVVLIVVVLGTLRASAQNSALLAGSGTGIFLDSLKDGKQVGPNSVSFADNKGVFKAGKITYSGRYFLQSYQVSFQYGLNRQGVPASSAVLDLKAGEKDFIDVKQAVHKADSIGSALKQVLSASTDAKMAVVIDGPQKYLGLEHFNIRTEEGGWSFIKPGISGRLHSFEINSLFYPLKQHLPADSVKLLKWLDSSVAGWSSGYVTRLIQELNPMIFIPYSYTYTCYAIEGSSVTVDSVASLLPEWKLNRDQASKQYIKSDLLLIKEHSIKDGKLVVDTGGVIVLDKLTNMLHLGRLKWRAGGWQVVVYNVLKVKQQELDEYLDRPSEINFPTGAPADEYSVSPVTIQLTADLLIMNATNKKTNLRLPSSVLFFLSPMLKPY